MFASKNSVAVKLPMINQSFYKGTDWTGQKVVLDRIRAEFSKEILQAERLCRVPKEIIECVLFLESGGKKDVVSHAGAVGCMQLTPDTATGVIHMENKKKRLTEEEKTILRRHLGARLDCILKMSYMAEKLPCAPAGKVVTAADLKKPELNILLGTMLLGQLIDEHTEKGVVRLDKVIIRYNAGYFYKPVGKTVAETLAYAKSKGGVETSSYILKFVGATGVLTKRTGMA